TQSVRHRWLRGPIEFETQHSCLRYSTEDLLRFRVADQFDVVGLRNRYRTFGLGVPLIALREPPHRDTRTGEDQFLPTQYQQALPVTLVARVEGSITHRGAPSSAPHDEQLLKISVELYDPLEVDHIDLSGRRVELETDFTTPIAYMLSHAPPAN